MAEEPEWHGSAYPGGLTLTAGLLMVAASAILFVVHLYAWLRQGDWPQYTAPQLFSDLGPSYPHVSWVGVQKVIDFFMGWSATTLLFWVGVAVAWLGGAMLGARDERIEKAKRVKWQREQDELQARRDAR